MSSSGSNTVTGTSGNDNLNGGSGDDVIYGGAGSDKISAGSGDDTLNGGSGSDSLNGGAGNDTLVYNVCENSASGTVDVYTGGSGVDTLVIQFSSAEWGNSAYRQQVSDFLSKLAQVTNAKTGEVSNGSASDFTFSFGGSKLTVQMTETLQVFVDNVKVLDSTDKQAAALRAPDLTSASDSGASSTDNVTNDNTPTFTGSGAEPLATVKLYAGTTCVGSAVAGLDGSWSVTAAALGDGTHQVSVVQVDLMGNASAPSVPLAVTIDTQAAQLAAPDLDAASDSGSSVADDVTNDSTPTVKGGGAEAGATVTLYDTDGTTVLGTTTADANGNWSVTTGALADGEHSLTVEQTDIAGNTSTASAALKVTIDTNAAAPSAPDLEATSDSGSSASDDVTKDSTPTVSGGGAEKGATVTLYDTDGTTVLGSVVADQNGNWSITSSALADGEHSLTVKQTDIAGNTSTASAALKVTIDTNAAAPSAPDLEATSDSGSSASDDVTKDSTPTVSGGGAEKGATVTLYDTDGTTVLGSVVADQNGNWSITTGALADGEHGLTVKQTDIAGNTSTASAALKVTVDTHVAPPGTPDLEAASDSGKSNADNVTNDKTPTVSGDGAEDGATVTLYDTDGTTVLGTTTAAADGSWSITSSILADGEHSLTVKQTDIAGNESGVSAALKVTIDTQAAAPSAPDLADASDTGVSNSDNVTNDKTPTVSGGGAEDGATVTLYDTDGTTVLGTTTAAADGSWSITSNALADGEHSLTVKQADIAGNESGLSAALKVTIDTQAAAPSAPDLQATSDSGPVNNDDVTNDKTPTVSGSGAEKDATVTLYDSDGTTVLGTTTAAADGSWSITSSALADGEHSLTVKQTDIAGNTSTVSSALKATIDTQAAAPSAPDLADASDTGNSNVDNVTQDGTPTVSGGGAEKGATVTLYDTDGTTVLGSVVADQNGNWSITSSALADGEHSLTVRQTDIAGNESGVSAALKVTIDTHAAAPSAPDLATTSDSGASTTDDVTQDSTPTVSGSGAEKGATVTLYDTDGTTVLGSTTAQDDGSWSITSNALADGEHGLTVKQTDIAGNTSTASAPLAVKIDTQAAPLLAPDLDAASDTGSSSTDNTTSDNTPSVSGGGAEAGAAVKLYEGTTLLGSVLADASGNWSITSSALADGPHSLTVKQTDTAGNTSTASAPLSVKIDTQAAKLAAPDLDAASDTGTSSTDNITKDNTPTLTGGGAEVGATVKLYEGSTELGSAVADASGNWTITSTALIDGLHSLTATQTDLAGNTSVASAALALKIDTQAAAPTIVSITDDVAPSTGTVANHGSTNDTTPTLSGLAEANGTVTVYDGSLVLGTVSADNAGAWTFTTSPLVDGAHLFSASVTDAAGNASGPSAGYEVTVTTNHAPTDISLSGVTVGNAIPAANTTIATLSTTDADAGDTFTYALGGTDASTFKLVGNALATATDLDQGKTYQVSITSSDQHGASYTEGFRIITGNNGGGSQNDTLNGGSDDASAYNGEDVLLGGSGTNNNVDILFGFGGDDLLYGQGGNDQLHGGLGNDVLQGGAGNDTFYFDTALSSTLNVDRITDFNANNADSNGADKIQLSDAVFHLGGSGTLAAADFGTVNTSGTGDLTGKSVGANVNVVFDATTGALYYDTDGGSLGNAQLFAFVTATGTVDNTDFLLGS